MLFKPVTKDGELYHSYCIASKCKEATDSILFYLEKDLKFKTKGNPDFWFGQYDILGVDESRIIKDAQSQKPTTGDKKVFIISANFITEQAQNAMLKMFEEPTPHTHFFLVSPSSKNFISTLRSRMMFMNLGNLEIDSYIDASDFLKTDYGKRIELIKKLSEKISDDEESKIRVITFFQSLEQEIRKTYDIKISFVWLEEIEKARLYAVEQSPSLKMLMEHIALLLPVLN
jgi:DNA polymerase III delta prime subunit